MERRGLGGGDGEDRDDERRGVGRSGAFLNEEIIKENEGGMMYLI